MKSNILVATILLAIIFSLLPIASAGELFGLELNPFADKKIVEKAVTADMSEFIKGDFNDKYGVIRMSKTFLWIETDKIAEYSLTKVSDQCLINCYAYGKVSIYKDMPLFNDVEFLDKKGSNVNYNYKYFIKETETYQVDVPDKYEEVCIDANKTEYCYQQPMTYKKEDRYREVWNEYDKRELRAGDYEWKIEVNKEKNKEIDFIPIANDLKLDEWAWWNETWNYKKQLNITGSQVTLNDFVVFVNVTYDSDMQTDFDDIRFANSTETGELSYELNDKVNSKYATYWVKIPIVNPGERNTTIYMYYGNTGASTSSNGATTWANYTGVYHLESNSTTKGAIPEAKGVNNMTLVGNVKSTPQIFGNGILVDTLADTVVGGTTYVRTVSTTSDYAVGTELTVSYWQKVESGNGAVIDFYMPNTWAGGNGWSLYCKYQDGKYAVVKNAAQAWLSAATSCNDGTWKNVVWTRTGTNNIIYVNGVNIQNITDAGTYDLAQNLTIGLGATGNEITLNGTTDEVRILKGRALGAYYVLRDYENQNMSKFVFGAEETGALAPPSVTFNSQTPADINSANVIATGVNITYNITASVALNTSAIVLSHKINSTTRNIIEFVNGTNIAEWFNTSYDFNISSTFSWRLEDNHVYPATYNVDENITENNAHSILNLGSNNQMVKIQFLNVTNTTAYNFFEIMTNSTAPSASQYYYCNSTYTTGSPVTNNACSLINTLSPIGTYNHTHSAYSKHQVIPLAINVTSGAVSTVKVTPTSYLIERAGNGANGWNVYYVSDSSRLGATATTTNTGTTWTNQTYTVDAHLHQFSGNSSIWYLACAKDINNNETCSSTRQDLFELGNLSPSSPQVYSPINSIYLGGIININYTAAVSPNGYAISNYNITLWNSAGTFNQTIRAYNNGNLSFVMNGTAIGDGNFFVQVRANDTLGQESFGNSEIFTIASSLPSIVITNPLNTTYFTTQFNLTAYVSSNITNAWYSLNGATNLSINLSNSTNAVSCFQEYSNISTSCGGLNTGIYSESGAFLAGGRPLYDGDWSTEMKADLLTPGQIIINYTKPSGVTQNISFWEVKDHGGTFNLTISPVCWNAYANTIELRAYSNAADETANWDCWNGTGWNNLRQYATNRGMYEEAMLWSTNLTSTIFNLNANFTATEGGNSLTVYGNSTEGLVGSATVNFVVNTTTSFSICGGSNNIPYINFTFYDEYNNSKMSAILDQADFTYYTETGAHNYLYSSTTQNAEYSFCFYPPSQSLNLTVNSFKYANTGYPQRTFVDSFILTNTSTSQPLYLLPTLIPSGSSSGGLYSSVQTVDAYGSSTITGVFVIVERQIAGNWVTVGTDNTDSAGVATFWVNSNYDHRFTFSKVGYENMQITIRPSQTLYTVRLSRVSSATEAYNGSLNGYKWIVSPGSGRRDNGLNSFTLNLTNNVGNLYSCKFELVNVSNKAAINTTTGGGAYGCLLNISYNLVDDQNIFGRISINNSYTHGTYEIIDTDYKWIIIDQAKNVTGSLNDFISSLKDLPDFGETNNRSEFSRVMFFFIITTILIAILTNFTNSELQSPGSSILIIWCIIFIASLGGFLSFDSASDNIAPWIEQYGILIIYSLFGIGFMLNRLRRET